VKFALSPGAAKAILREFDWVRNDFESRGRDVDLPSGDKAIARGSWHSFTARFASQLADCAFSDKNAEFELDFASFLTSTFVTAIVLRESLKRALKEEEHWPRRHLLRQVLSALEEAMGVNVIDRLAGLA